MYSTPVMADIPIADLVKAEEHLRQIEAFYTSRLGWRVEPADDAAVAALRAALAGLTKTLAGVLRGAGLSMEGRSLAGAAQRPPAALDRLRFERFADFVRRLDGWVRERVGAIRDGQTLTLLKALWVAATTTEIALATIRGEAVSETALAVVEPPRRPLPTVVEAAVPVKRPVVNAAAHLALESTIQEPLLTTSHGVSKLSERGRALVAGWLAANGVDLAPHELAQLHAKVVRWIMATPEEQVLVLKVGVLNHQPCASYIPKKR